MMKECLRCPLCGQGIVEGVGRSYSVFIGRRHPNGVCSKCGGFYWERDLPPVVSSVSLVQSHKEEVPATQNMESSLCQEPVVVTLRCRNVPSDIDDFLEELKRVGLYRKSHRRYGGKD